MRSAIASGLIAACLLLLSGMPTGTLAAVPQPGQPAPGFVLPTLAGEQISLDALRAKGHVLLLFWAAECPYCHMLAPDLKALHARHHENGLTVAGINIGAEYAPEIKEYVRDNEINYLILADRVKNLDVAEAYGVFGTPTLALISPDGKLLYRGHKIPDLDAIMGKK